MQDEKEKRKNMAQTSERQRRLIAIFTAISMLIVGGIVVLFAGDGTNPGDECGDLPASQISIGDTVQAQITDPFAESAELVIYERPNSGQQLGRITDRDNALVIAGAHCLVDRESSGRYWRIQTEDGIQGWVMEIASFSDGYLLLPVSE